MNLEKINNIEVRVIKHDTDKKEIIHKDLFDNKYPNILLLGMKHSGKTLTGIEIIRNMVIPKKTHIFIFSKTYENDKNYEELFKILDKYKSTYQIHDSLDDPSGKYQNILIPILEDIKNDIELKKKKHKKEKKIYVKYLFYFDDFSEELKNGGLISLFKKNRHYQISIIISTQYYTDISPSQRQNLNYLLLYPNMQLKKLEIIFSEFIRNMKIEDFITIYYQITKERYNFLYINCDTGELRKNFNQRIIL